MRDYWRRDGEICKASKFILCSRGVGTSSVRLFDTMRMGRVPVILSDQWLSRVVPVGKNLVCGFRTLTLSAYRLFLKNAKRLPLKWGCLLARSGRNGFQRELASIASSNGAWTLRDGGASLKVGPASFRTFNT